MGRALDKFDVIERNNAGVDSAFRTLKSQGFDVKKTTKKKATDAQLKRQRLLREQLKAAGLGKK